MSWQYHECNGEWQEVNVDYVVGFLMELGHTGNDLDEKLEQVRKGGIVGLLATGEAVRFSKVVEFHQYYHNSEGV